jgi:3-oxoacyl-[acyl-carrier protein] reductase
MELGLRNRVAIVTGASEGIGKATAIRLAQEGARVVICARRRRILEKAALEIRVAGQSEVLPVVTDITRPEQIHHLVQTALAHWGRVDILVNNAGTSSAHAFEDTDDATWAADMDLKLLGAIRCIREVLPIMKEQGWGRIVNITAIGGKAPDAHSTPTSVTRAAGIAFTKAISKEYASHGILVNTVCIGLIKTRQHEQHYDEVRRQEEGLTLDSYYQRMADSIPLGRVGEPVEAADVITFLVSERASFITGVAVNVDGGASPVV